MDRFAAVADDLDRLAEQIRRAAAVLRAADSGPAPVASAGEPWCDPWSIVDLVTHDLSRRGIKTRFGAEADLASAARSAAQLLMALGLPPDPSDGADPSPNP